MPISATSQQEFSDADFRVVDNGDQSKKLAFEVSGIATATTRTWTSQNDSGTVAYVNNQTFTGTTTIDLLSVTGGQIAFPATQSPSSDANTLDDYETGTWTVGVTFGGGATSLTFSQRSANYTKIADAVILNARFVMSAKGSSTGTALATGAPFQTSVRAGVAVGIPAGFSGLTGAVQMYFNNGGTTFNFTQSAAAGSSFLSDTVFTNTTEIAFSVAFTV